MSNITNRKCRIAAVALVTLLAHTSAAEEAFPRLSGAYLGETPPGEIPMVFAPGIISLQGSYEGGATFSADGSLFAYKRYDPGDADDEQIWISERVDGVWSQPTRAPFDGEHADWDFSFASNGSGLYFTSRRPVNIGGKDFRPANIWMTIRSSDGWSEPRALAPPINGVGSSSGYPSLTTDGTMYFHSARSESAGEADIYFAPLTDGRYLQVVTPAAPLNTEYREIDPTISPDGSYIVFLSDRPGVATLKQGPYISFRLSDHRWSEPESLAAVLGDARLPILTPDGRYLFYASGGAEDVLQTDIYWVSTDLLEQFRP